MRISTQTILGLSAWAGIILVIAAVMTFRDWHKEDLRATPAVLNRAEIMCAKFGGQPKVRDVVPRTKNGTKLLDLHVSCRGDLTFIIHTIEDNR